MKRNQHVLLITTVMFFFSSCNLFKKSGNSNGGLEVINLDTLETIAKSPEPSNYQASPTRINDIIHTSLDVKFDWEKQFLYGKATILVKPYFYPVKSLELDARGMEIKEILLLGNDFKITGKDSKKDPSGNYEYNVATSKTKTPLKYTYEKDVINIQLDREYKNTEEYTIYIEYIAKPNELGKSGGSAAITDDKGLYFINPEGKDKTKPQQIWTQGETQSSSVWFPTIDRSNERMTQEIYMTVDKKYSTLSNGELAFSTENGDGTRTDCWKMELPHAPYLAMMAVGDFAIVKDAKWHGKEVNYYVEKEYEAHAKAIFGNTPEMLEFYSNKLGVEYPWSKYSQIVVRDYVSGAMENTTSTLHGEYLQRTDRELLDRNNEDVIAHELFHQWFGDLVTCESWSNLPLNESFATYGEYLWEEYKYGREAADLHSAESRAGYFAEAARKQVPLIRFQYNDKEDMFDGHSYNKGGQVLHMLRTYVGEDAFFASLKLYLETNKYTSVEIHQLRLAFEKVTGEDLNWFFNQWFLSAGHPDLVIKTEYDATRKKQKVQIKQVQDFTKTPLFSIPLSVDIYQDGKAERKKIWISSADETFEFDAASKPDLVNVDAEKAILCNKNENKSLKEMAFQYSNAPLYLDRYEALVAMASRASDSIATHTIISALDDKFWSLRADAISLLKDVKLGNEAEIKRKLMTLAQKDEKAAVRTYALDYLSANYKDADLVPLYKNALNDRSYGVLASGLGGIAKTDAKEGMALAKQYEKEKNNDVLYAIADLYANHGSDEQNQFFLDAAGKFNGFGKIGYIGQYGLFLKRVSKDETVNSGIKVLEGIAKDESTSKWVAYYAKKNIKDVANAYEEKVSYNEQKIKTLKESNPNAPTQELEKQIENDKAQKQRVLDVYNSIK
ncbi:MAG: hypothetical protein M3R27_07565 [Bacteroidota bacterium]|nr:hypothetical protein [Bacteroidota bacterium]